MGHNFGWLALGASIVAGAYFVLIPDILYDIETVAGSIHQRHRN